MPCSRRRKRRDLWVSFAVITLVSLIYNGFAATNSAASSIEDLENYMTPSSKLVHDDSTVVSFHRRIWMGIPISEEEQAAKILNMYLSNSSSHAFQNVCPAAENPSRKDCAVYYRFLQDGNILSWWEYVQSQIGENEKDNPLILWVSDRTILYPRYFMEYLKTQERKPLLVGQTPTRTCAQNYRPERMTCQKLSGMVTLISYRALKLTAPCWKNATEKESTGALIASTLATCQSDDSQIQFVTIPRQFARSKDPLRFWDNLIEWNSSPVTVDYITAKFGREDQFASAVQATEEALLSFGMDPKHVHAYFKFPQFILEDSQWQRHLEFLTNMTLKPRGAGYWFWKAPLILHHLRQARDGDFVVFADADVRDHCKWQNELIRQMLATETNLALYQVDYQARKYTKRDVYEHYCHSDPTNDLSYMLAASWIVVRNTQGIVQLLEEWQKGMVDFSMVSDEPSKLANIGDFEYHLHDQSILNAIVRCHHSDKPSFVFEGAVTLKDWTVHMFRI